MWPSLARVTLSLKATMPLLPPAQPGSHSHPPCPLHAMSPLLRGTKRSWGGPGAGGAEPRDREAPTVTRTTGCSREPLVAAAESLQTSPGTAGVPLPPNPQPGGCSSPPAPQEQLGNALETPSRVSPLSRVRALSPHPPPHSRDVGKQRPGPLRCPRVRGQSFSQGAISEVLTPGFMARCGSEPSIKAIKSRQADTRSPVPPLSLTACGDRAHRGSRAPAEPPPGAPQAHGAASSNAELSFPLHWAQKSGTATVTEVAAAR